MHLSIKFSFIAFLPFFIAACQPIEIDKLALKPMALLTTIKKDRNLDSIKLSEPVSKQKSLSDMIDAAAPLIDVETGFIPSLLSAMESDPAIAVDQQALETRAARISALTSGKEFQVSGSVYGGVEDVSDQTSGIAIVLSANRLIFDGGQLDAEIESERLSLQSSELLLEARKNEKAMDLAAIWIELDQYETLSKEIESRLSVLTPLIDQLERVAEAGIGDVTRVAAAQRTVSVIEATKAEVLERREQARLKFINTFGNLPKYHSINFDPMITAMPTLLGDETYSSAPALKSRYLNYQSKEALLASVKAKADFTVGFEALVQRPFGGSARDSDEKVGFVASKTLYNGERFLFEVKAAESEVQSSMFELQKSYRDGESKIVAAQQKIVAMDTALELAKKNVSDMRDEIAYLKQQLIIGGSTLDSVLTAEARLYDATAKVIDFTAEKRKAILMVLSSLGLLTSILQR